MLKINSKNIKYISSLIHDVDPYKNFMPNKKIKLKSFSNNEFYLKYIELLILETKPNLVIEVGSWLGHSAIQIAKCLRVLNNENAGLVCVDTWLGSREFWTTKHDSGGWWNIYSNIDYKTYKKLHYKSLSLKNGYPTLYYDFLSNIVLSDVSDMVVPFPQTSCIAARWFKSHNIFADAIYIDGSHDYDDVKIDIELYWEILSNNGVIFGDDFNIPDVRKAVEQFSLSNNLYPQIEKNFWKIKKQI